MNITITKNLKTLRKTANKTQENFAEFLTISINAVSKWERGECYPDIELLPRIAAFYNVTVDDLLGVGDIRKRERIEEYSRRSEEFAKSGDTEANIAVWLEAEREFPNNWDVLHGLMWALYFAQGQWNLPLNQDRAAKLIEIGDKMLAESSNEDHRRDAIQFLTYTYVRLGDKESAQKYANMGHDVDISRDILLCYTFEGDDAVLHYQTTIDTFLNWLCNQIFDYAGDCASNVMTDDEEKRAYLTAVKVYDAVIDCGDFGHHGKSLWQIYNRLANISAKKENADEVIEFLEKAAFHAKMYDTQGNFDRKSLLLNRLGRYDRVYKYKRANDSHTLLEGISDKRFDFCRDNEAFTKILEDVREIAIGNED